MTDFDHLDQEPHEPTQEKSSVSIKARRSFSKLRRELSDEELSSPAVQRMLLDEIDRLDKQVSELEQYRKSFYDADKRAAVLEQRTIRSLSSDIMFAICLSVGAAALGYAPALWQHQPTGIISVAFGAILIIGSAVARLILR
jgi:hypothetical protein